MFIYHILSDLNDKKVSSNLSGGIIIPILLETKIKTVWKENSSSNRWSSQALAIVVDSEALPMSIELHHAITEDHTVSFLFTNLSQHPDTKLMQRLCHQSSALIFL